MALNEYGDLKRVALRHAREAGTLPEYLKKEMKSQGNTAVKGKNKEEGLAPEISSTQIMSVLRILGVFFSQR